MAFTIDHPPMEWIYSDFEISAHSACVFGKVRLKCVFLADAFVRRTDGTCKLSVLFQIVDFLIERFRIKSSFDL